MKRIREFLESVMFAGLKPSGGSAAPASTSSSRWRRPLERLLSGPAPKDPLYLSNRSLTRKLLTGALVVASCLIAASLIGVAIYHAASTAKPVKDTTAAEITAAPVPDANRELKQPPPAELQVVEIKLTGSRVVGKLQNTGNHQIEAADLIIDLTDSTGSRIGAVRATVQKIPAGGRKEFQIVVHQPDASFALIREVTAH